MYGCKHYSSKCRIIAPCCEKEYWCRHCHNEDQENQHGEVDRFKIKEVVCGKCGERQPVSNSCINSLDNGNSNHENCDVTQFARYFCSLCNLWDDKGIEKNVFHCNECGICRIGGNESYFHCKVCSMCYPISIKDTHRCIENSCNRPCPLCLENLFHSIKTVSILNCGHTIHEECLFLLGEAKGLTSLRCPICSKSLADNSNIWSEIDKMIAESQISESSLELVKIFCNDCTSKSNTYSHPYGLKCQLCGGYNTRIDN
ncbi:CHY zinc finger domain-containing protein [Cryptosporidium felis]|nr:CHY zinc finger domain-containing protein [Cryptosporidium felis]